MKIRTNWDQIEIVHFEDLKWISSPTPGVWRKMLERDGEEIARATTIVKFEPGINFPEHVHGGGEEFFVLEGTFIDHTQKYPVGTYVRHPIHSKHQPWSDEGCLLLVKLCQMVDESEPTVVINTKEKFNDWIKGEQEGVQILPLFQNIKTGENVLLEKWNSNCTIIQNQPEGGEEIFVLEGEFIENNNITLKKYSWLRNPEKNIGKKNKRFIKKDCLIFKKTGHLTSSILNQIQQKYFQS